MSLTMVHDAVFIVWFCYELMIFSNKKCIIGPLHYPVTWYKTTDAGEQVAQWDFQNNVTRASPPGPVFALEVPLRNLLTSICNFLSCDRIVQRAYSNKIFEIKCFFLIFAKINSLRK